jgi:hypothetical protein
VSLVGSARRQQPVPQLVHSDYLLRVTSRLRSCRDVFTGRTRVKEIAAFADPLVSNLTTLVIGPPLDATNMPERSLTAPSGRA